MSTIDCARVGKATGLLLAAALLAACQAVPQPPPGPAESRPADPVPVDLPEGREYRVLREESELRIVLYPAGPLARFGHAHVIGGPVIEGGAVVAEAFRESGLSLRIPVRDLEVDRPEWRVDEGFEPDMPASTVRDTRDNMLSESVLHADAHPLVLIESVGLQGPEWQPDMDVRITLRGVARELTVPVSLSVNDDRLIASGRFVIRQSDFGIEPFSAMGGRLQVADEVLIRFRVLAVSGDGT